MDQVRNLTTLLDELDGLETRETIIRSPLRWPGGKERSIKHILQHLPYKDSYVEPFGGTGVVLLNRKPSRLEVYNDRFGGIVALYRVLKDKEKFERFMELLKLNVWSREEFLWCRDTWNENHLDDVERAARWYYSIAFSFASKGRNFGRQTHSGPNLMAALRNRLPFFLDIHRRIQNVLIENQDWQTIITDFDSPGTVFYLDPPYYGVKNYYTCGVPDSDHVKILELVFKCRGFVAISGYANDLYDSKDWSWDERHTWTVTNNMLGVSDGSTVERGLKEEVLWIKYET